MCLHILVVKVFPITLIEVCYNDPDISQGLSHASDTVCQEVVSKPYSSKWGNRNLEQTLKQFPPRNALKKVETWL